ncbi:hypothetical protein BJX65DRAFT_312132 [Aspergillus insuetus]
MPNKSRKAKFVAQAGPVESGHSAPPKANKKRKAKKDLNNPRSSPNAAEACAETVRKDDDPVKSPVGLPSSSRSSPTPNEPLHKNTHKDAGSPTSSARAASNPVTPPAAEQPWADTVSNSERTVKPHALPLSHDAHPSGEESTPIHQMTRIITKIKGVSIGKTGGEFVSLQDLQSKTWTTLVECGHVQTKDELTQTTAFIGLKRKGLQYTVVFTTPCDDSERTFANECMDHYLGGDYRSLAELLIPLLLPLYEEADDNPVSKDNFGGFLHASETYLRVVPVAVTGMLEPYPEFARSQRIDWDLFIRENRPTCPMWKVSDVKRFHPHSNTSMIYDVDLGDNLNSVVFKRADSYRRFLQEYQTLLHCGQVGIRAPRVLGLLGVGTRWAGFIMTKISASFCLEDRNAVSVQATSIQSPLADRKRWFEQISNAIHTLHHDGYIWGDVKAANVLIDDDNNACLIDFEGGCSLGWVDEELADSEEGDLQGLDRLRDFLKLDE